jgi:hypothetical protein
LLPRRHFPETDPAQPEVAHKSVLAAAPKTATNNSAGKLGAFFTSRNDRFFGHDV